MPGIENFGLFLLWGIMLNITPGADTMYIIGRSISQGKKAGIMSVLGISSGSVLHTLFVSFGLSVILVKSVVAFNAIKCAGAVYLIYLGIKMIFSSSNLVHDEANTNNMLKIYGQGVITNLLNPKVALFFMAFLPQFVATNNNYGPLPFLLLGITFITTGTLWCVIVAIFSASATRKMRNNEHVFKVINKLVGVLFIGLGLKLVKTKLAT